MLALTVAAASPARADERVISLSPAQLTDALRRHFPQRSCLFGLLCVSLSDPRVRLVDGDSYVYVQARVEPELPGASLASGRMEVRALPRFEPAEGAFYADGAELVSVEFPGMPGRYQGTAGDLTEGLLAEVLRSRPVHMLDERDGRQALARLVLRGVRVDGGRLRLIVGGNQAPTGADDDPGPTRSRSVPAHRNDPVTRSSR